MAFKILVLHVIEATKLSGCGKGDVVFLFLCYLNSINFNVSVVRAVFKLYYAGCSRVGSLNILM